jgi:hypothetical protein
MNRYQKFLFVMVIITIILLISTIVAYSLNPDHKSVFYLFFATAFFVGILKISKPKRGVGLLGVLASNERVKDQVSISQCLLMSELMDAGQYQLPPLSKSPVKLRKIFEDIKGGQNINFETDGEPTVLGDENLLMQIFLLIRYNLGTINIESHLSIKHGTCIVRMWTKYNISTENFKGMTYLKTVVRDHNGNFEVNKEGEYPVLMFTFPHVLR